MSAENDGDTATALKSTTTRLRRRASSCEKRRGRYGVFAGRRAACTYRIGRDGRDVKTVR